jgi:hypothetical protein
MPSWVDVLGWAGAIILLSAYALVSVKRLEGNSSMYQILNLIGGALLIVNTFFYGAFPSTAVNLVWITIAVFTLARNRR